MIPFLGVTIGATARLLQRALLLISIRVGDGIAVAHPD